MVLVRAPISPLTDLLVQLFQLIPVLQAAGSLPLWTAAVSLTAGLPSCQVPFQQLLSCESPVHTHVLVLQAFHLIKNTVGIQNASISVAKK